MTQRADTADRLLLDEWILADGRCARSWARREGDQLRIADELDGEAERPAGEVSVVALDRVMARYGRPIDDALVEAAAAGEALDLGAGRLARWRYHAPVDATGRDYLVWERPGEAPLAVLAAHATAALRYLALRLAGERGPQETEM